jgi:hypothetical protein
MKALATFLILVGAGGVSAASAHGYGVASEWDNVLDFMVQDACVDGGGKAIIGMSPADPACQHRRDLLPGEVLPYHKTDWPGDSDMKSQPFGYERSDSFPFDTTPLGTVVVQTFDFAGPDGRKFGVFDHGDGGQVVGFSHDTAAVILTEDGGAGLQLMAGPRCAKGEDVRPGRTLDSWMVAGKSAESGGAGSIVAKLRIVKDSSCPTAVDSAFTEWHYTQFAYRASLDGKLTPPLRTLLSSHFGGTSIETADHLERFYFTKEFGWTRWERWQNMDMSKDPATQSDHGKKFAASGRCQTRAPAPGDHWLMLDCREWTNIVQPDQPGGDAPDFWLNRLQGYPLTHDFFVR